MCMETVAYCQHVLRVPLYRWSSPLPNRPNHHPQRRRKPNAALNDFGSAMRDLTLRRITANRISINLRSHHHHHPNAISGRTMSKSGDESLVSKVEAEKKQQEESPPLPLPLPPPPEKPLPGDCCGSGCVRCVWDIYYEELEDYNNLCKSNSDPKPNAKPA